MPDNQPEVTIPEHQKLLQLSYPPNPERQKVDLTKHAFQSAATKQEVVTVVASDTPEKVIINTSQTNKTKASPGAEEQKGLVITRHDSLASADNVSLESNPAKFSDDEEMLDPYKIAENGLTRQKRPSGS